MKKYSCVYTILLMFMVFIQQIISGCTTTVTKDVQKNELIREDLQKEKVATEKIVKEELHKEESGVVSQKLYQEKCSPCHILPDIDAYGYSPEQWVIIIDAMHDPGKYSEYISIEEDKKIKDYLKTMSRKK